jgi:hypothetical protein
MARRERRKPVDHGPDTFSFWKAVFWPYFIAPGLFIIGMIVILIIMGALKALGVKEL